MPNPFPIRLYGDPILRRRAQRVERFDAALEAFAVRMVDTMLEADGAGLAAPQVGVPLRIFVLAGAYADALDPEVETTPEEERAAARVFINPEFTLDTARVIDTEGCLSIPGVYAQVERAASVTLTYQDLSGQRQTAVARGRFAKAVQHEMDHLDGVLFLDRLPDSVRATVMEEHRSDMAQMQRDARAHLKALRQRGEALQPWP
jgi:peptide deformylase